MTNPNNFQRTILNSSNPVQMSRGRIGTSATEIELLDDLPSSQTISSSRHQTENRTSRQQFRQSTGQPLETLSYQEAISPLADRQSESVNDANFDTAVDNLLRKYAPDAIPKNLVTTNTERQSITTTTPQNLSNSRYSASATPTKTDSHVYSTINRSNRNQTPILNHPERSTTITNRLNQDLPVQNRPDTTYNNFKHTSNVFQPMKSVEKNATAEIPSQQQKSIAVSNHTIRTTHTMDGQWQNLNQDPLEIFYERQNPKPSPKPKPTETVPEQIFTTFQPSAGTTQPDDLLSKILSNYTTTFTTTQKSSSEPTNENQTPTLDLGVLLKSVQQDYLRQIEPFVSSVKFIEKDQHFGQHLNDIGFITPISLRKGFRNQAEDLLRRSGGRTDPNRRTINEYSYLSTEPEHKVMDATTQIAARFHPLQKNDSQNTLSSLTSVSSTHSDVDSDSDEYPSINGNSASPSKKNSSFPSQTVNDNKTAQSIKSPPMPVTKARRVPSDEISLPSSDNSTIKSGDKAKKDDKISIPLAQYNEHESSTSKLKETTASTITISNKNSMSNSINEAGKETPSSNKQRFATDNDNKLSESTVNKTSTPSISITSPTTVNNGNGARFASQQSGGSATASILLPTNTQTVIKTPAGDSTARVKPTSYTSDTDSPALAFKDIQETPMLISRNARIELPTAPKPTPTIETKPPATNRIAPPEASGSTKLFGSTTRAPPESNISRDNSKSFRRPWKSLKKIFHRS